MCPQNWRKADVVALNRIAKKCDLPYWMDISVSDLNQWVETAYVLIKKWFYECRKSYIGTDNTWRWRLKFSCCICSYISLLFSLQRNCGLRIFFLMQKFWNWKCTAFGTQNPSMGRTLLFMFFVLHSKKLSRQGLCFW